MQASYTTAGNGLQAVKAFFGAIGPVDVEVHRVIADGDLVAVHSNYKTWNSAGVDIFRFNDDGKIIEHWDVLQPVPENHRQRQRHVQPAELTTREIRGATEGARRSGPR